ncbi:hypothetical protein, partial [Pinisolibacter sp.]|uniref:hypothetical protein n=1 Tax=Pinisolibacter sp. TaxID=2172024 RepID=UPI002FDCEF1A
MAKMILLKVNGDDRVFVVNIDALTVEAFDAAELGLARDADVVVAGEPRSASASHALYGSDTRSDAASHALYGSDTR